MRIPTKTRMIAALLTVALFAGCQSLHTKKTVVTGEPGLVVNDGTGTGLGGSTIVQAPETRVTTVVDRHPFLNRPRDWYDSTKGNKLTRTAAAAFIGVPMGIGAEVKQIFVGQPPMR